MLAGKTAKRLPRGWQGAYDDDEVEVVPCPVCKSDDAEDVAVEMTLVLARCRGCGLEFARRRRLGADESYRPDRRELLAKYGPVLRGERPHTRDPNYDELLDRLEPYRGEGRLLDVGPHMGFFARRALARGWRVEAVEQSPVLARLARESHGIEVHLGYMHEVALDPVFDVVTMLDVIEHVPDPVATLASAAGALRPGGVLMVKTPNVRWNRLKHRLGREDSYDLREHILQFRAETLADVVRRAGLEPSTLFVPRPVQTGGPARRALRRAVWLAGVAIFRASGSTGALSPDLCLIARRPDPSATDATRGGRER